MRDRESHLNMAIAMTTWDRMSTTPASTDDATGVDNPDNGIAANYSDSMASILATQRLVGAVELGYFILGLPLNLLVVYICSKLTRRHANQRIVLSMTVADCVFVAGHCPFVFVHYHLQIQSQPVCLILFLSTYIGAISSSLSLLLLNIDKFFLLHKPLHYSLIVTTPRLIMGIAACWVISLAWAILILFGPATEYTPPCNFVPKYLETYVAFLILFFCVPICLSLVISAYIGAVVVQTQRKNQKRRARYNRSPGAATSTTNSPHRTTTQRKRRSASRKLTILMSQKKNPTKEQPNADGGSGSHVTMSPTTSGRNIKSILFVFSTTIWSVLTCLPYRLGYILVHMKLLNSSGDILALFYTFLLMAINPIGNPIITIVTQRSYVKVLQVIWGRMTGRERVGRSSAAPYLSSYDMKTMSAVHTGGGAVSVTTGDYRRTSTSATKHSCNSMVSGKSRNRSSLRSASIIVRV